MVIITNWGLLQVLDADGSGTLDLAEWTLLYEVCLGGGHLDTAAGGAEPAFYRYCGGGSVKDRVDLDGLASFIKEAMGHLPKAEFDTTIGTMLERASMLSSHRAHERKLALQAKQWSQRIIVVIDLDGNGVLDEAEFYHLYRIIPGAGSEQEARGAYLKHAARARGGVDQPGFEAFLVAHFQDSSFEAFAETMLALTEAASSQSALKATKKKKLSSGEIATRAKEWSGRLFMVMDLDASGDLDEEEFGGLHACLATAGIKSTTSATGDFCTFMCVGGSHNGKIDEAGLTRFLEKALSNATEEDFVSAVGSIYSTYVHIW